MVAYQRPNIGRRNIYRSKPIYLCLSMPIYLCLFMPIYLCLSMPISVKNACLIRRLSIAFTTSFVESACTKDYYALKEVTLSFSIIPGS